MTHSLIMPPPAQGLHGLQAPAAQGLQPPAAQGLQPPAAQGLQPPAAQGLHGLQAASWIVGLLGRGTAVGLADWMSQGTAVGFAAPTPLTAATLAPVPATAMPTPAISGTTALDRSLIFNARMEFSSLVIPHPAPFSRLSTTEFVESVSHSKISTPGEAGESLIVTYS